MRLSLEKIGFILLLVSFTLLIFNIWVVTKEGGGGGGGDGGGGKLLLNGGFSLSLSGSSSSSSSPQAAAAEGALVAAANNKKKNNNKDKKNKNDNNDDVQDSSNIEEEEPPIMTNVDDDVVVVAYAISVIKCGDFQSSQSGLVDAAAVLRHSVHLTSNENPKSKSKYGYKMYAIVHSQAVKCGKLLEPFGYEILIRDSPINPQDIKGEFLKKHIHKEWCCGSDEFVKLYAYEINNNHPIVVHTDIDFVFWRPMDDLFDAMLLDKDSQGGKEARERIEVDNKQTPIPDVIEAYITRDYHQIIPGRIPAFQAGFLVIRPNKDIFKEYVDTIIEGNYVEGFSRQNGWGGLGYGGVVGAMAMQGIGAYYYDHIRPNTSVELNGCRYNFMGANIKYMDVPNFNRRYKDLYGKCRNGRGLDCEDCMKTDTNLIKNVHYTNCRKPWNCAGTVLTKDQKKGKQGIDTRTADYDQCMKVIRKWHEIRTDFENKLYNVTKDGTIVELGRSGNYKKDVFMGHCQADHDYLPIAATEKSLSNVYKIYEEEEKSTT